MKFPDFTGSDFIVGFRQLLRWCWSTRILGINGIPAKQTPNGSWLTLPIPDATFNAPEVPRPYAVRKITKDPESEGNFLLTLYPGWVREIATSGATGADGVVYYMPTTGGIALDTDPAPEISAAVEDYLYVNYETDKEGNITGTPEVIVSSTEEESTHYQPIDGDGSGGTNGNYYVRLGQLRASGTSSAKWVPLINSDVLHIQELWTGQNLGSGGRVFKKRDPEANKDQFRTILTRYGLRYDEEVDELMLDFDAENIGGGSEVLKLPEVTGDDPLPDEIAQFRTIRGLTSSEATAESITAQIAVEYGDGAASAPGANDTIRIRGNGAKGSRVFYDDGDTPTELGRIEWQDGLVTSQDDEDITIASASLPDGSQGDMLYWNVVEGVGSWTLLANPGAPSSGNRKFQTHDGTAPVWIEMEGREISICDGGTPVTKTIYVDI